MSFEALVPLLIQYGLPTVQYIVAKIESKAQVTSADITALIALESRSAKDEMLAVLKSQNIDPASPQGVALLALT